MQNDEVRNEDRIEKVQEDLNELKIPKTQNFSRHLILHEIDFLHLINTICNQNSNMKESNENNNNHNNTNDQDFNNVDIDNESKKDDIKPNTEPFGGSPPSTATVPKLMPPTDKWKKQISKIVRNKNLSDLTKTELVIDLFLDAKRREDLAKERLLPGGTKRLLGAGNPPNSQLPIKKEKLKVY